MLRKPGFPVANCSAKIPEGSQLSEVVGMDDDAEQLQRRQQLINFGHTQWGFNNWSWSVTKQELDFVDFSNGKFCAGVVAFVSITVKSFDIHRENIGYATSTANNKGAAIYKSRKGAVTNALRETLLSFGGSVATELMELVDHKSEISAKTPDPPVENNQNLPNKIIEVKNTPLIKNVRKDSVNMSAAGMNTVKNSNSAPPAPPIAKAMPIPSALPPANRLPANARAPPHAPPPVRPNSNDRPLEGMTEEEARAERKRRQQRAQDEFRKQMAQQKQGHDERQDLQRSSFDNLLMDMPTQDIEIEQTGEEDGKRKSPGPDSGAKRRASGVISRLDIVTD